MFSRMVGPLRTGPMKSILRYPEDRWPLARQIRDGIPAELR